MKKTLAIQPPLLITEKHIDCVTRRGQQSALQLLCDLHILSYVLLNAFLIKHGNKHVYMSGLGLIYLVLLRWSRCTPGLRTGNV
jgi:hypothetical protein